jgi:hypothetical protein
MAFVFPGAGALDYATCNYGGSRLLFRGPRRDTERAFVAVLGGSETYGKYVRAPYPDLLERELAMPVANLGVVNAGLDVFLNDPAIVQLAARAAVAVVQICGAQNNSNRYYSVHPRRNDRFLAATPALRALYPAMDFTEFHFTRHLLHALHHQSADHFALIAAELRRVWLARMRQVLGQLTCPKLVLWVSDLPPSDPNQDLFLNPMLIDQTMIDEIARHADAVIHAIPSAEARLMGLEGMGFAPSELPAAAGALGPYVHREICDVLHPALEFALRRR